MEPLAHKPVTELRGVTESFADKLYRMGIRSLLDLVFHLPARYQDRTRVTPLGELRPGQVATVQGKVIQNQVVARQKRMLLVTIEDDTGVLELRFFHFYRWQLNTLEKGRELRCFGEVRTAGRTTLSMTHPEYQNAIQPLATTLTPIYPLTTGVSQIRIRALVRAALEELKNFPLEDPLFDKTKMSVQHALLFLHAPPRDANLADLAAGQHPAQKCLALEELLAHQVAVRRLKRRAGRQKALACRPDPALLKQFHKQLPFSLTECQNKVTREIFKDIGGTRPMMRLLQGDVGSGKTVVAALSALAAISNGCQAAIMAPTEILAEQHLLTLTEWFAPLNVRVAHILGKLKGRKREEQLGLIRDGTAQIVVGTHALFQESLVFHNLALVIIDEQHRFGVGQRLALRTKARQSTGAEQAYPHQLVMTATPIPRTLSMTAYADLDFSTIRSLPPGRTPVSTSVMHNERRGEVVARLRRQCLDGVQAYWVCALIEESEELELQSTEQLFNELSGALPELSIEVLHGRMNGSEKADIMRRFKQQELQLLVATTVVEVGVDVPNATLMIIENAERFGLAQLHQLRGRVGRGSGESHCVLLFDTPLSGIAKQRLAALRDTTDGFVIAERDLELRGPGELLGTRQTGDLQLKVADLLRDQKLLLESRELLNQLDEKAENLLMLRWLGEDLKYARA